MARWNDRQQEVLDSAAAEENVLVSAAAGSGKTAVMVERIVNAVVSGKAGIDEILVVTFTKAAAAQMKAKIRKKLEEYVEEQSVSEVSRGKIGSLLGELSLMNKAEITTIDSFCNHVVKEHFNVIGIDPSFDMMDGPEAELLKEDILEQLFADRYLQDEKFRFYIRAFSKKNHDTSELKKIILKIARVADSFASPARWIEEARSFYIQAEGDEKKKPFSWLKDYEADYKATLRSFQTEIQLLLRDLRSEMNEEREQGITVIEEVLQKDLDNIDIILDQKLFGPEALKEESVLKWAQFRKSKAVGFTEEEIKKVTNLREIYKKQIKSVLPLSKIEKEQTLSGPIVLFLLDLVEEYQKLLLTEKKQKKLYEFNDIAHFAYQILCDEVTGEPTNVGKNYSEQFRYIYIDEYQDGNDLQEQILTSVARRDAEGLPNNIFMVGDVKQSIYRFRLARPQLFMDKAETYHQGENAQKTGRLINLNMNYRSRKEILDGTNFIFDGLMTDDFGRIPYDEAASLHYPFEVDEKEEKILPEILFLTKKEKEADDGAEHVQPDQEGIEAVIRVSRDEEEAFAIACKICELIYGDPENGVEPFLVTNKEYDPEQEESEDNPKKRPARYSDIVILQRGVKGTHAMMDIYEKFDIPVVLDDANGYFDAEEVTTMLSVLSLIDNRIQDIPFAAVLRSPIGRMTDNELAKISLLRTKMDGTHFTEVCAQYLEKHPVEQENEGADPIAVKLHRMFELLDKWKNDRKYLSIPELMDEIYQDTDYDLFVTGMPNGDIRRANLDSLRRKAENFAVSGSQAGNLFEFLRYMEKCKIHEIEFAEPAARDSSENAVHVCTIHKSKGLEYPIVIIARMGHEFNKGDYADSIFVSPDHYITTDKFSFLQGGRYIGIEKSDVRKTVSDLEKVAAKHEELRLLYVAMTRAEEKLIMTGFVKADYLNGKALTYQNKKSAKSYMDFILPVIFTKRDEVEQYFQLYEESEDNLILGLAGISLKEQSKQQALVQEVLDRVRQQAAVQEEGVSPYKYRYEYTEDTQRRSKLSVSDIKKAVKENTDQVIQRTDVDNDASEETEDNRRPASNTVSLGAERGTIVHKVMELLPFVQIDSEQKMKEAVKTILLSDSFTNEERKKIDGLTRKKIYSFYCSEESSLFQRMKRAMADTENGRKDGLLFREQQFLTGIPVDADILRKDATNLDPAFGVSERRQSKLDGDSDEIITVQGIIDAFFYEKDSSGNLYIVLVDYKTDRVKNGEELKEHYLAQMDIYAETIEKISGVPVKEAILFGLTNQIGEVRTR